MSGDITKAECARYLKVSKPRVSALLKKRATRPEICGHAGFRLNALVSLLANASWAKLAAEFIAAKEDPAALGGRLTRRELAARQKQMECVFDPRRRLVAARGIVAAKVKTLSLEPVERRDFIGRLAKV